MSGKAMEGCSKIGEGKPEEFRWRDGRFEVGREKRRGKLEVGMKWDFLKEFDGGNEQSGEGETAMGDKVRRTGEEEEYSATHNDNI